MRARLIRALDATEYLGWTELLPVIDLDSETKQWVEDAIRKFTSESSPAPPFLKSYAERYSVLPLSIDWSAFYGLRPDGEILLVPDDDPNDLPTVEREERLINLALYQGALKYPYLQRLIPNRPPNARDCPHCEGRGKIEVEGIGPNVIVCYCGGIGWLPESSDDGIYSK